MRQDPRSLTKKHHTRRVIPNVHMYIVAATEAVVPQYVPKNNLCPGFVSSYTQIAPVGLPYEQIVLRVACVLEAAEFVR